MESQPRTATTAADPISLRHTERPLDVVVLRSRVTPLLRRLLPRLGARMTTVHWPGVDHPALERVVGPAPKDAPQWLEHSGTEDLIAALRCMEQTGTAPEWARLLLVHHRAGGLLGGDGELELADGLTPGFLIGALLRLPRRGLREAAAA